MNRVFLAACGLACLLLAASPALAQTISTVVGTGTPGSTGDGAAATAATLNLPFGVATDAAGNLYIAERAGHRIRRVDAATGDITTVAGTGTPGFGGDGGAAIAADLNSPSGIAVDPANGDLIIADTGNHRVRRVEAASGNITTVAGDGTPGNGGDTGPGPAAQLNGPFGVVVLANGDVLITDENNHRVRCLLAVSGDLVAFAGQPSGTAGFSGDGAAGLLARLNRPRGITRNAAGDIFIADSNNQRVRRMSAGTITTVAGDGTAGFGGDGGAATSAQLNFPHGVAIHPNGSLYIADSTNNRVRLVDGGGNISTFAGTGTAGAAGDGGPAASAQLNFPFGLAFDSNTNLFIADRSNHKIRRVTPPVGGTPPTIAAQPQSASQLAGGSVSLVVTANGTFPLAYQWFFTNGPVAGAIGPTFTLNPAQVTNSGPYFVVVTNAFGSVTSAPATLTITNSTAPPTLTAQPQSQSVIASNTAVFSVTAVGALPLAYQWFFNAAPAAGATNSTLALPNAQPAAAGNYFVVVTNAFGSITSAVASLAVITNPPPPFQWAQNFGDTGNDTATVVAVDNGGNLLVAGTFSGSLSFGTTNLTALGTTDAFVAKFDTNGVCQWVRRTGGVGATASGHGVAVDAAGNVIVHSDLTGTASLGSTNITISGVGGVFVAKYNPAGTLQWVNSYNGQAGTGSRRVATDAAGNIFIGGNFNGSGPVGGTVTFGTNVLASAGMVDAYLVKLSPAGSVLWARQQGGPGQDGGVSVGVDPSGNCYTTFSLAGTMTLGTNSFVAAGPSDTIVAKYDANGALLWARQSGGSGNDFPQELAVDSNGSAFVSGEFGGAASFGPTVLTSAGGQDAFIAKYDPNGNPVFAKGFGGTAADSGLGVGVDASGFIYLHGNFRGTFFAGALSVTNAVGGQSAFTVKLDAAGNPIWLKSADSAGTVVGKNLAVSASGNAFIVGNYNATTTFAPFTLTNAGQQDFYFAKIPASVGPFLRPAGLVGWWAGDGFAVDYASTNHGNFTNSATTTPAGQVGGAFAFNGTTSAVVMSTNALKAAYSNLTIEAWVFPTNHSSGTIYGCTVIGHTDGDGFALRLNSGVIQADLRLTAGDVLFNAGPVLPLNTWSHIACTYDGTRVTTYLNGAPQGFTNATGTIRNSANAAVPLLIGHEASGVTTVDVDQRFAWAGRLDEVAVFSRALAATEIQSIVAAGPAGKARPAAPMLLAAPLPRTVDQGAPADFSVAAAGYAPLAYQWRLNGTNLSGQTNATLNLPAAYSVHEGGYDVRVTQLDGANVISPSAALNVLGQGEAKTLFGTTNDVANFIRVGGGAVPWTLTSSNTIIVVPGTGNIQSTQNYGDFLLHAEFLLPATGNGNSGIYLQNRYEIQIFNSFGVALPGSNDVGAVWGQVPPSTNAALPAGQWQTYDITFRQPQWNGNTKVADARVTVVLNGVVVQDNVAITNRTTGGANEGPTPGPVVLQDNGTPVQFRNVRVTPLDLPPEFAWARQFGSTNAAGNNTDFARDLATDAAGNVYVTGSFFGTASFGPTNLTSAGDIDFFLAKYTPTGALIWIVRGGGPNFDSGQEVAVGPDGSVYVAGLMESGAVFGTNALANAGGHDLFLAKYAPDGQLQWIRTGGGSADDGPHGLTVDAAGNVYVTGHLQNNFGIGGTNLLSAGLWDSFLAKYDSAGNFQWVRQGAGTDYDYAQGVVADGAGNVYTAITFQSLFGLGATNFANFAARDLCLASYDSSGTLRWARQFALPGDRRLGKLRRDAAGNLLLALNFSGTLTLGTNTLQSVGSEDIFLAKFDANGSPLWARQGGSTGDDFNTGDLAVDAQGNAFLVTSFVRSASFSATALPNAGTDDVVVAKYNAAGAQLWALSLGSAGTERALGVAVGPDGQALVGGTFANTVDFRGTTFTSFGGNDGFVGKLAENQPVITQQPVGGNVLAGQNTTFSVTATGAGGVTYQWRLNGTNLAGATNSTYTVLNATTNAAGTYDVLVTHAFGSTLSSPAVIAVIPSANPLPFTFAERFGSAGTESLQALARDAAGNAYVGGYFTGTLNLGATNLVSAGGEDLFVAKFNPAGALLWAAHAGGPGEERVMGLALDPNGDAVAVGWFQTGAVFGTNGAVAVAVNTAAFLMRVNAAGQLTGFHKVDASGGGAGILRVRNLGVAVDASGFAYVAGKGDDTNSFGGLTFGRPEVWGYLAKYDRAGAVQWIQATDRLPGTSQNVIGRAVALDQAGGVYLAGNYGLPGGASGTNAIIGGVVLPYGGGDADGFVAKFATTNGAPVWTRGLHGSGTERIVRLATDAAGNIFAGGDFDAAFNPGSGVITPTTGGGVGLLLKLDASGTVLWAREAGAGSGTLLDGGALTTDPLGNVYLAHNFSGTNNLGTPPAVSVGGRDGLVTKFAANGAFLWAQTFGSAADDAVNGIVFDAGGNLLLAGTLGGAATLGPFALTNAGGSDFFLARLAAVPPVVTTPPASQTVNVNQSATFAVAVTGTLPIAYQWRFNGVNLPGATNAAFTVPAVTPANAGGYSVLVADALGITNSATATLVVDTSNVPFITGQPQGQTVLQGSAVLLTVTAVGASPLSYQWRKNGTNLAGENFDFLALGGVGTNAAGSYSVVVTNVFGAATSAPAVLTVTPVFPPVITTHPASLTVLAGSNATFTVAATGTAPFSYQWVRNGVAVPGNDAPTLTVTNATLADAGGYFVQVFNSAGLATSAAATLTVHTPPQFLSLPQAATVLQGRTTNFSASASGTPTPAFQWFKDGVRLTNTVGFSGVATPNLLVLDAQAGQAGGYVVVVTNVAGAITSAPVALTVLLAPTITAHPTNVTLTRTNYTNAVPVTLSVAATGEPPLLYQWRFNGADLPGQTNTTLTLTNVTRFQNGVYQAVVSNLVASTASSNAVVRVRVAQRVEPPVLVPGQPFRLRFTDDNGELAAPVDLAKLEVQATAALLGTNTVWVTLTNGFSVVNGMLQFDDPASTNLLRRYYRIIER